MKNYKILIEALESIASLDHPEQERKDYWLSVTHESVAEVATLDTNIAREALKEYRSNKCICDEESTNGCTWHREGDE